MCEGLIFTLFEMPLIPVRPLDHPVNFEASALPEPNDDTEAKPSKSSRSNSPKLSSKQDIKVTHALEDSPAKSHMHQAMTSLKTACSVAGRSRRPEGLFMNFNKSKSSWRHFATQSRLTCPCISQARSCTRTFPRAIP